MRAVFQWAFLVLILAVLAVAADRACRLEMAQDEARIQRHLAANREGL